MNYDPNLTLGGKMATQTVKLVFGVWDKRWETTVTVGGNCTGFIVMEGAVDKVYDGLPENDYGDPFILLSNEDGTETLDCVDEEREGEDWLRAMLIKAEITEIEAQ